MNERIKSLIERAEYQALKQSGSDWEVHVEPSREQIFEKFAELIVEECATVIERNLFQGIGWNTSRAVRRHFGIEDEE
jgi:hypothetical protein